MLYLPFMMGGGAGVFAASFERGVPLGLVVLTFEQVVLVLHLVLALERGLNCLLMLTYALGVLTILRVLTLTEKSMASRQEMLDLSSTYEGKSRK